MSSLPPLTVTHSDFHRLTSLVTSGLGARFSPRVDRLTSELARARVVPREQVAPDVVTMNSRVEYSDNDGPPSECTVVYPWDADPEHGRVSVLSPLGAALLGLREGDSIPWNDPSGRVRHWKVLTVLFQPEASGAAHL